MKRISSGSVAAFLILILIAFLQSACKENTLIDARVDPNHINGLTYTATFSTLTKTVTDDSVITSFSIGSIPIYHSLGTLDHTTDKYFGDQTGEIYFQVIPSTTGFHFAGSQYIIDSAILILPYAGFTFGDTTDHNASQSYTAYMTDLALPITVDTSTYHYASTVISKGTAISNSWPVNISALKDSVLINGVNQPPHARIPLNSNFIAAIRNGNDTCFANYYNFTNYLKGLYISSDNTTGKAIPYFRLDENGAGTSYSKAGIIFYYHTTSNPADTTFTFYFDGNYCSHYNHITHDNSQATAIAGNVVLLQNQPGDAIDIKIYGFKAALLQKDPVTGLVKIPIINKAELNIPVVGSGDANYDSLFFKPTLLYATGIADSMGYHPTTYTIADRYPITSTSALSIIDGSAHYNASNNLTTYIINIPREIQNAVVNGKDTVHLRINGTKDFYGAYRLVAGGGNYSDSARQIRLKVVYSKLK